MAGTALTCAIGLDRREERITAQHALDLLDLLGLATRAGASAESLSYGEQRRLEIARALASDPELLVLDEPVAGMNTSEAAVLGMLLRRIRDEFGKTILLIEHDMDLVMGLCEQVTVLNFGHVIANGTPTQVQQNEAVVAAYLGAPARPTSIAPPTVAHQPVRANSSRS